MKIIDKIKDYKISGDKITHLEIRKNNSDGKIELILTQNIILNQKMLFTLKKIKFYFQILKLPSKSKFNNI